jgi:hypothetical protein
MSKMKKLKCLVYQNMQRTCRNSNAILFPEDSRALDLELDSLPQGLHERFWGHRVMIDCYPVSGGATRGVVVTLRTDNPLANLAAMLNDHIAEINMGRGFWGGFEFAIEELSATTENQ